MSGAGPVPDAVLARLRDRSSATRIAVVGASANPAKYGHIIVGNLLGKGYTVLPVNPSEATIHGLPVLRSVAEAQDPVHVVDFVTPPRVTLAAVQALAPRRFPVLWFQDGSFDDAVLAAAAPFPWVVHHACIMVVTNWA